jgi:hypothetical protein
VTSEVANKHHENSFKNFLALLCLEQLLRQLKVPLHVILVDQLHLGEFVFHLFNSCNQGLDKSCKMTVVVLKGANLLLVRRISILIVCALLLTLRRFCIEAAKRLLLQVVLVVSFPFEFVKLVHLHLLQQFLVESYLLLVDSLGILALDF